jgi:hypothetical protein
VSPRAKSYGATTPGLQQGRLGHAVSVRLRSVPSKGIVDNPTWGF